jgi:hypothetical protein
MDKRIDYSILRAVRDSVEYMWSLLMAELSGHIPGPSLSLFPDHRHYARIRILHGWR